jgi:general secretion pathway protein F
MSNSWRPNGAGGRLTGAEAAALSDQIAGLAKARLPLASGLVALGEELPRGRLRRSMNELARTLEKGVPLEQAVESQQGKIPPHLRGLVIAGIRSGDVGDVLSRFTEYVSVGTELKRRLWLSLAYPVLTVSIAFLLFVLVCVVVVGQFETLYRDFGIPLPRLTIALLFVGRIVNSVWGPLLATVAVVFGSWLAAHAFLSPSVRRSLAGRPPLLGTVWRSTSLAEFCHLLALLLESRLPLPEALRLAGEGVQDADVDAACRQMECRVESGRTLAHAIAELRYFPAGLARLLHWAEREQALPEVLHMAGSMFEARARSYSAFVGTVLNVLCAVLVFGMILIVPALFAPLFTLISRLAG